MAQIARAGVFFHLALSILIMSFSSQFSAEKGSQYAAAAGVILSAVLLIYQIIQEKSRHEKAKLQLITLENAFGFFEVGQYLPNKALYPSDWRNRPKIDQGLVVMCLSIAGTGVVLIFMIFSL